MALHKVVLVGVHAEYLALQIIRGHRHGKLLMVSRLLVLGVTSLKVLHVHHGWHSLHRIERRHPMRCHSRRHWHLARFLIILLHLRWHVKEMMHKLIHVILLVLHFLLLLFGLFRVVYVFFFRFSFLFATALLVLLFLWVLKLLLL